MSNFSGSRSEATDKHSKCGDKPSKCGDEGTDGILVGKSSFSSLSIDLTKSLSKTDKKNQGIFFTPPTIVEKLVQECVKFARPRSVATSLRSVAMREPTGDSEENNGTDVFARVLEPSCGSGEFIRYIDSAFQGIRIDAVEQHPVIFHSVSTTLATKNAIRWTCADFIHFHPDATKYDLIIGNPPYAVVGKDAVPEQYAEYMVGRPNLFGLFIVHSMSMLAPGGIMAFIVPKSFLNAGYYAGIRMYMKREGQIRNIVDFEATGGFLETQQSTIGLVFQKHLAMNTATPVSDCPFSLRIGGKYVFSENADELRALLAGSTTLQRLGLSVKTGNIVWNQKKELLTDDARQTLLLYNSNITKDNTVRIMEFKNDEKKQYIHMAGSREMVIVVNRGNGNSAYQHTYALVDGEVPYLAENHLNVIYSDRLVGEEKRAMFESIARSFENPKTEQFIRTFLGNNGLSKTELETVFPIFRN